MKSWAEISADSALLFLQVKTLQWRQQISSLPVHKDCWLCTHPCLDFSPPSLPPFPPGSSSPTDRIGLDPHSLTSDLSACSESSNEWMHGCWKRTPLSGLASSSPYKGPLYAFSLVNIVLVLSIASSAPSSMDKKSKQAGKWKCY